MTVETAFLVVKTTEGDFYATSDLSNLPELSRKPTDLDIKHGCIEVIDAIAQSRTISTTIQTINGLMASLGEIKP